MLRCLRCPIGLSYVTPGGRAMRHSLRCVDGGRPRCRVFAASSGPNIHPVSGDAAMSDSLNRREFLGTAAAGSALLAAQLAADSAVAAEAASWPKLPPAKIYKVFAGRTRRRLPHPSHRGDRQVRQVLRRAGEEARRREVRRRRPDPAGQGRPRWRRSSRTPTPC